MVRGVVLQARHIKCYIQTIHGYWFKVRRGGGGILLLAGSFHGGKLFQSPFRLPLRKIIKKHTLFQSPFSRILEINFKSELFHLPLQKIIKKHTLFQSPFHLPLQKVI
jgi:hypothetical protein